MAWDDVTGKALKPQLARTARMVEIDYFRKMEVYTTVSLEECVRVTGKQLIGARCVDIHKQDEENYKYRSRLATNEIKRTPMPELYAATPPLECLSMLLSDVMTTTEDRIFKKLLGK